MTDTAVSQESSFTDFEFRTKVFPHKIEIEGTNTILYDATHSPIGKINFFSTEDNLNMAMILTVPATLNKQVLNAEDINEMEKTMEKAAKEILNRFEGTKIHLLEFILTPIINVQLDMITTLFSFQYSYIKGVTVPCFNENVELKGAMGSLSRILKISPSKGIKQGQEEFASKLANLL